MFDRNKPFNDLSLLPPKDEIENIFTTEDELYKAILDLQLILLSDLKIENK